MITFDFEYVKPQTISDVTTILNDIKGNNQTFMYYAGGTEFISRARAGEITTDVVIDLANIPECHAISLDNDYLILGSMVTLTQLIKENYFPLLSTAAKHIGHQTARNTITIGGNLMSHLPYREALLPFLLANSTLVIATSEGNLEDVHMQQFYKNGFKLPNGSFLVQIRTATRLIELPFYHRKHTKQSKVNYPIVTLVAMEIEKELRIACSGIYSHPFRSEKFEATLNDSTLDKLDRLHKAIMEIELPVIDDMYASSEFRVILFKRSLIDMFKKMEGIL